MAGKKRVPGARGTVRVTYRDETVQLASLAYEHGIEPSLLFGRWRRAGRPDKITSKMLRPPASVETFMTVVDGVEVSVRSIKVKYGISVDRMRRIINDGKQSFTSEEIKQLV